MPAPTLEQIKAIRMAADAIVETVAEAGTLGAPSGPMYAAMNAKGFTLRQYQGFMDALVSTGRLRQEGDLYFIADKAA